MTGTRPALRPSKVVALCATALLLAWSPAFALNPSLNLQQYGHAGWLVREGFVKGTIRAMAQTSDGYLWLGTDLGLVRFDGVRAVPWTPPPGQQLPSPLIHSLLAGRDGTLWIGTFRGLVSWSHGQLTPHPEIASHTVSALLEDSGGTVWVGTSSQPLAKLCAFRGGQATCFGGDGTLGDLVWSLAEDGAGSLWVAARTGLWRWTPGPPSRHRSERLDAFFTKLTRGPGPEGVTFADSGDVRDVGVGARADTPLQGLPAGIVVTSLFRDREGGLWIGTDANGIFRVHDGAVDVLTSVNGLSGDLVTAFLEDHEGTMWVATTDGLDSFRELPIVSIALTDAAARKVNPASIVAARDGSLWIGSEDGLHRRRDGHTTTYRTQTHPGLPDNRIQSLFEDERGRIWVTGLRGLAVFDNDAFTRIGTPHLGYVFAITGDGRGGAWVSSFDQGVLHVAGGKVVQRLSWQEIADAGLGSGLAPDGNGGVWIAMTSGILSHVRDGRIHRQLTTRDGLGEPLVNVQSDADGAIWAATEAGFTRILDGHLATMTAANGLPCNEGHWVIDDAEAYWFFLRCGLVRVPRADVEAWAANPQLKVATTTFDAVDGVRLFAYNRLERPQVAKSRDGRIWFILPGTLATIDPDHLQTNPVPPPVHVEQITADGTTFDARPGLRLPANTRDLRIDYTGISLMAPQKVAFRFKLDGQDPDWRAVTNERTVHYSNLPPGDYRFRVAAANNSGVWNDEGDVLDFSIVPAYYQTNAFRALCLLLFAGVLWGGWQLRLRQLHRQVEMTLGARTAERTRIARDLHDTLLQDFQGLLLMFQSALKLLPDRPVDARQRLQQALAEAIKATTTARNAVQGLRSPDVERDDLVRSLTNIGGEVTGADHPAVQVEVSGTPLPLTPMVRGEVYRIAAEALRNALRHAEANQVTVEIRYDRREFRIWVRDDGVGIDDEVIRHMPPARHFGLQGMRERAEAVGGRLEVRSKAGEGTVVDLSIPAAGAYATSPRRSAMSRLLAWAHVPDDSLEL